MCTWSAVGVVALSSFSGGLLAARILYEWLFPTASWLGQPGLTLIFALVATLVGLVLWRILASGISGSGWSIQYRSVDDAEPITCSAGWKAVIPFLPWLGGLFYLLDSSVNLTSGRLLFFRMPLALGRVGCLDPGQTRGVEMARPIVSTASHASNLHANSWSNRWNCGHL